MSKFSFLLTTDNHLGYKQDDYIRRKDAFMAFAEALEIARQRDVDFVLLGGDLFHTNRPSTNVEHKCIKIIRQHMSAKADRNTTFKKVSGNFSHTVKLNHANFEDRNLTVPYPIMTIHGNHDDPTGPQAKSVCEKLATCGLLNYFGLVTSPNEQILVEPIVLMKDNIKLALYGIGFIPDLKLRAAFERGDVIFSEPPGDSFNILVVHQNRIPFSKDKYIPDEMFPKFFHLIVRGHEHEAQSPEKIPDSKVDGYVYQPGSTVATSISTREAGYKRVGLMEVHLNDVESHKSGGDYCSRYKLNYELIPLKCCRQILSKDIAQKEIFQHIKSSIGAGKMTPADYRGVFRKYVTDCIEALLEEAKQERKDQRAALLNSHTVTEDTCSSSSLSKLYSKLHRFDLPLLRIRLEYVSKSERFDEAEISSKYYPKFIANKDVILFKKQKISNTEIGPDGKMQNITFSNVDDAEDEEADEFDVIDLNEQKRSTIDTMIESYFLERPAHERLEALSLTEYTQAVQGASEDGNVISKVLAKRKDNVLKSYRAAVSSEEVAEKLFHDEGQVRQWFHAAFQDKDKNQHGADHWTKLLDDEDVDIIWED